MNTNDQRKADIKSRIAALSEELQPLLARVESLKERIQFLESELRDILEAQRAEEARNRPAQMPQQPRKEWVNEHRQTNQVQSAA
jgi:predicted  nucleic acid-binding Zn-ribbon protein